MLSYACPGESAEQLAELTIGERDRDTSLLREKTTLAPASQPWPFARNAGNNWSSA